MCFSSHFCLVQTVLLRIRLLLQIVYFLLELDNLLVTVLELIIDKIAVLLEIHDLLLLLLNFRLGLSHLILELFHLGRFPFYHLIDLNQSGLGFFSLCLSLLTLLLSLTQDLPDFLRLGYDLVSLVYQAVSLHLECLYLGIPLSELSSSLLDGALVFVLLHHMLLTQHFDLSLHLLNLPVRHLDLLGHLMNTLVFVLHLI